jgi:hypothetical protein
VSPWSVSETSAQQDTIVDRPQRAENV